MICIVQPDPYHTEHFYHGQGSPTEFMVELGPSIQWLHAGKEKQTPLDANTGPGAGHKSQFSASR